MGTVALSHLCGVEILGCSFNHSQRVVSVALLPLLLHAEEYPRACLQQSFVAISPPVVPELAAHSQLHQAFVVPAGCGLS